MVCQFRGTLYPDPPPHCQIYRDCTAACCGCKQNDQFQRLRCRAEGFWCVGLCPPSWTLGPGSTDETFLNTVNSGSSKLLARCTWDLFVRVFCCVVGLPLSCTSIRTSSWEYITTLDFELDIIRGRRSYRSTIWVSSDGRFYSCRHLSAQL